MTANAGGPTARRGGAAGPGARATAREAAILAAATERFMRYGFRRTSLEDIAREAGLARPSLYLRFRNKEEIFRAVAAGLHERALQAAEAAANGPGSIEARLGAVLEAKLASCFEIAHGSPHAGELMDENNRICGDVSERARRRLLGLVRRVIESAVATGELAPARVALAPAAAALLVVDAARGLETMGPERPTPARYRARLAQLVRVLVAGLGGSPA